MVTRIDVTIDGRLVISAGGTTLGIGADTIGGSDIRLLFDGPARQMVDQLDKLAAGALEIRGRLLRELATDEDA